MSWERPSDLSEVSMFQPDSLFSSYQSVELNLKSWKGPKEPIFMVCTASGDEFTG